jgi:flagellar biogenesis protein FliO
MLAGAIRGKQSQRLTTLVCLFVALLAILGALSAFTRPLAEPPAQEYARPASAANGEVTEAALPQEVSVVGIWAKLGLLLLVGGGMAYGARVMTARGQWRGSDQSGGGQGLQLSVRDTIALGRTREVHLIEVGERLLVIGSSQDHLSLLAQFSREGAADAADAPQPTQTPEPKPAPRLFRAEQPAPNSAPQPPAADTEWEWTQRRARLIHALQQVEE